MGITADMGKVMIEFNAIRVTVDSCDELWEAFLSVWMRYFPAVPVVYLARATLVRLMPRGDQYNIWVDPWLDALITDQLEKESTDGRPDERSLPPDRSDDKAAR